MIDEYLDRLEEVVRVVGVQLGVKVDTAIPHLREAFDSITDEDVQIAEAALPQLGVNNLRAVGICSKELRRLYACHFRESMEFQSSESDTDAAMVTFLDWLRLAIIADEFGVDPSEVVVFRGWRAYQAPTTPNMSAH